MNDTPLRLTATVQKGGCAAKIAATELRRILARVQFPPRHAELLVDGSRFDDAAIYQIDDRVALVQTIDFFTPIVDTPRTFGAVAAANALSDVYAMGGRPKTCLAILAFPLSTLPSDAITDVLQGACDTIAAAGATLAGGHSIDDDSLKFGLSVTGVVAPQRVWANTGARKGDVLFLTKALGTGTSTAALKRGAVHEIEIADAISSMCRLNNVIDVLDESLALAVHGATDITGFGLSGHAMQMADASGVSFEIEAARLPVLPRVQEFLEREFLTKAHRSNRSYTEKALQSQDLEPWRELLLHDPQTSGGLLLAVDANRADEMEATLSSHFPAAARIGRVRPRGERSLVVF